MRIDLEPRFRALAGWFAGTGAPLRLVGGYVRNRLLGLPVTDADVCAPIAPAALEPLANADFSVTERAYGLGTVVICQRFGGEEYQYEYTAFRTDSYGRGGGHRPSAVSFTDDIAKDAARRDFTINALYADMDGTVLDPLGRGLADLGDRRMEAAAGDTMRQDALRVLRLVRFAAQLGFAAGERTLAEAAAGAPRLADIAAERIRDEFLLILLADAKYGNAGGALTGLFLLRELGALRHIVPELLAGDGFAQRKDYHAYDVLEHSFRCCAAARPDLRVRLAALLHDVAKPYVFGRDGNMYRHPREGAEIAAAALRRLRVDRDVIRDVAELVSLHMFDLEDRAGRRAVVRVLLRLGREQFLRLCCLREADFIGSGRGAEPAGAEKWRRVLAEAEGEGAPISPRGLAVDGNDLMRELGIPPGKEVGRLLRRLHGLAVKKPAQNSYKNLIRYAKMMYTKQDGTERE